MDDCLVLAPIFTSLSYFIGRYGSQLRHYHVIARWDNVFYGIYALNAVAVALGLLTASLQGLGLFYKDFCSGVETQLLLGLNWSLRSRGAGTDDSNEANQSRTGYANFFSPPRSGLIFSIALIPFLCLAECAFSLKHNFPPPLPTPFSAPRVMALLAVITAQCAYLSLRFRKAAMCTTLAREHALDGETAELPERSGHWTETTRLGAHPAAVFAISALVAGFTLIVDALFLQSSGSRGPLASDRILLGIFGFTFTAIFQLTYRVVSVIVQGRFSLAELITLAHTLSFFFALSCTSCAISALFAIVVLGRGITGALRIFFGIRGGRTTSSNALLNVRSVALSVVGGDRDVAAAVELLMTGGLWLFMFLCVIFYPGAELLSCEQEGACCSGPKVALLEATASKRHKETSYSDSGNAPPCAEYASVLEWSWRDSCYTIMCLLLGVWAFSPSLVTTGQAPAVWLWEFLTKEKNAVLVEGDAVVLHTGSAVNSITFLFKKIVVSTRSARVLCWLIWALFLAGGTRWLAGFPATRNTKASPSTRHPLCNILARKAYHVACTAAFAPLILSDSQKDTLFVNVAILGGLGSLIALESVRAVRSFRQRKSAVLERYTGDALNVFVKGLIDQRDCRGLVVTHVYLLLGVGVPILWETALAAYASRPYDPMAALLGIIGSGVADAAAALCGIFGTHRLPYARYKKSWEGSTAFLASFLASFFALQWTMSLPIGCAEVLIAVFTAFQATLFEALTTEVDNYFLPLLILLSYRWVQLCRL